MGIISEDNRKQSLEARYWNDDGNNICIVASITKGIDWAAYIGACCCETEEEAVRETFKHGCKLSEADARYFFPGIDLPYRP